MQYFLLACDLLLWSSHAGQGFLVFFIKLAEVCKCFPKEWFIAGLPGCNQKARLANVWTIGAAGRVFLPGVPPGVCSSFISALILIVGEVGVQLLRDGWSVGYNIYIYIYSYNIYIYIAYKEKHYIITQNNNTPHWVMDCSRLPLGTIKPKVGLSRLPFFSVTVQIFACSQQHSVCK